MPRQKLALENLKRLDLGKVAEAFQHELKYVANDCTERPLDDKPRVVTIKFAVTPSEHDQSEVKVECEVCSTIPKRRSRPYAMMVHKDGSISFNEDSPDGDPTLLDEMDDDGRKRK